MDRSGQVRWGVLGTANIARAAFLPGLRAAGGGRAAVVASRDAARAEAFAAAHGVERAVRGYAGALEDPEVDAVYIPLVNTEHAEWTIAALRAGKAVLTEKPLAVSPEETDRVLAVARETGGLLWEAFVFPFHAQMDRLNALLAEGAIGELREICSAFHFSVKDPANVRFNPDLAGGSLNDVGCYPLHLACLLMGEAVGALAWATPHPNGVDAEMRAIVRFGADRDLTLSCGLGRPMDTFTRLLGTRGEVRMSNPFHPGPSDTLEVRSLGAPPSTECPTPDVPSFAAAVAHIHEVLAGRQVPRHLAVDDALATARALERVRRAAAG